MHADKPIGAGCDHRHERHQRELGRHVDGQRSVPWRSDAATLNHRRCVAGVDRRLHFVASRRGAADFGHLLDAGGGQLAGGPKSDLLAVYAADEC